ncbi:MAG: hypothetical protein JO287_21550 [Pseudonocardiales bacterium]|nr:hypothetical protein [Pseudonocardiales bacterium]
MSGDATAWVTAALFGLGGFTMLAAAAASASSRHYIAGLGYEVPVTAGALRIVVALPPGPGRMAFGCFAATLV